MLCGPLGPGPIPAPMAETTLLLPGDELTAASGELTAPVAAVFITALGWTRLERLTPGIGGDWEGWPSEL